MPNDKKEAPVSLSMLKGNATAEEVAKMYRALTGQDATPQEIENVRAILNKAATRLAKP
jgi:hypothetical protein